MINFIGGVKFPIANVAGIRMYLAEIAEAISELCSRQHLGDCPVGTGAR